jgi:hypothetical protein
VLGTLLSGLGLFVSAFADGLIPIILCTGIFAGKIHIIHDNLFIYLEVNDLCHKC